MNNPLHKTMDAHSDELEDKVVTMCSDYVQVNFKREKLSIGYATALSALIDATFGLAHWYLQNVVGWSEEKTKKRLLPLYQDLLLALSGDYDDGTDE